MSVAAQVLAGLLIGYVVVSLCESFFHRTVGHASPRLRRLARGLGAIGSGVIEVWYGHHVVHHCRTFRRDHVTQFESAHAEQRLRCELIAKGRRRMVAESYGARVGGVIGFLRHMGPTLPVFAAVCWLGGGWFTVGAVLPLLLMPLLSEFVHPYLHLSDERVLREAPAPIRWFAATPAFRFLARHHWLHHRYLDCNFNLMPGGDLLLGVHRRPSPADLAEMAAIGLAMPAGSVPCRRQAIPPCGPASAG